MKICSGKASQDKKHSELNRNQRKLNPYNTSVQFVNNRDDFILQKKLNEIAVKNSTVKQFRGFQQIADKHSLKQLYSVQQNRSFYSGPSVLQANRIENPYAEKGSHKGWDLTGHHVIAHSKLVDAFGKLDVSRKAEILRYSIPMTLTESVLENLKVVLPDGGNRKAEERLALRQRLVGEEGDDVQVAGIRLGDIRQSFYEWQGGNQFQGPNTSIRAEPSPSKHDTDYDGQYFSSMDDHRELTDLGGELNALTVDQKDAIVKKLKKILDLTKEVTPATFDDSKWTEIISLGKLNELAANARLNRGHILKYSFFKLDQRSIGPEQAYDKITGGSGNYYYERIDAPLQARGNFFYIPVHDSKSVIPKQKTSVKLVDLLVQLNVDLTKEGGNYKFAVGEPITDLGSRKFMVTAYDSVKIPYISQKDGFILASKGMVDNKDMETVVTGATLYQYCEGKGVPTSTFLPKELVDSLE